MYKKLTFILIFVFLPQISFGAWWNPLSWGESQVAAPILAEPEPVKPVEKVVTVQVDNPTQQKRIEELLEENRQQKELIDTLQTSVNQCEAFAVKIENLMSEKMEESDGSDYRSQLELDLLEAEIRRIVNTPPKPQSNSIRCESYEFGGKTITNCD